MSGKKVGVFGIYSTRVGVENGVDALVRAGFPSPDISVLLPESLAGTKEMGTEKATKAPEGTTAGVTAGGVIGGTLGVLAGVGLVGDPWPRAFHRRRPDHGRTCWAGRWRSSGRALPAL